MLWNVSESGPDVTSPLSAGERVYMVTSGGTLTCMRAATGDVIWEQELEAEYYSSPTLVGDVIHLTDMDGVTTIIENGDAFKIIGKNVLGEGVFASPAFAHGRMYLRGMKHVYAIGGAR